MTDGSIQVVVAAEAAEAAEAARYMRRTLVVRSEKRV